MTGLLFFSLKKPSCGLTKVAFDAGNLKKELVAFVERRGSVTCQQASNLFCKTTRKNIEVYCLCQNIWIEGTTAKAIYGPQNKEFNAHSCCECGTWFHCHCLKACGVAVLKRTKDFHLPLLQENNHNTMGPSQICEYLQNR